MAMGTGERLPQRGSSGEIPRNAIDLRSHWVSFQPNVTGIVEGGTDQISRARQGLPMAAEPWRLSPEIPHRHGQSPGPT
jgi:hypothetical protein